MLVEDDELVRSVSQMLAQTLGYQVSCFESSTGALAHAHATKLEGVDLLLTDVVMPELNGPALAHELLAVKPTLHVLYMSGYVDDPLTQHAFARPDAHFLAKPFSADEFANKIAHVLGGR